MFTKITTNVYNYFETVSFLFSFLFLLSDVNLPSFRIQNYISWLVEVSNDDLVLIFRCKDRDETISLVGPGNARVVDVP